MRNLLMILTGVSVLCFGAASPGQEDGYPVSEHVKVAMRDGVKLGTNVYLPEGEGPWPVILTRTPYNMRRYNRRDRKSVV